MGAADFVRKNGIFGINGITMVFCDCSSATLNGCLAEIVGAHECGLC